LSAEFYGEEVCLYIAAAILAPGPGVLLSPAVALAQQPEMVGDGREVLRAC